MQMVGILLSNTLYYFDVYLTAYISDIICGNSVLFIILQFMLSKVFLFCKWHRIIIAGNTICVGMAAIDMTLHTPVEDIEMLNIYYLIILITIIAAIINHTYDKEVTDIERFVGGSN